MFHYWPKKYQKKSPVLAATIISKMLFQFHSIAMFLGTLVKKLFKEIIFDNR